MSCHVVVPELFWPAAAGAEPYRDLELPALETLLARGDCRKGDGASLERWLAAAYRLPPELPLAPFSLRGEGADPGDHCWLRADPVHLRVHGDGLLLADASRLALSADDAGAFAAALNEHFAADGIAFTAPDPRRWYARLAAEPQLRTAPVTEVAGRSVGPFLPAGDAGARWRRYINEAQMLLHAHPRNEAREARGELPVNGVWFWGAGRDRRLAAAYDTSWTDHPLAAGLAAAAGARARHLPATAATMLDGNRAGSELVVLASLPATTYGDAAEWREALCGLERSWFAPLVEAVRAGGLESLTLHGLGPDYSYRSEFGRSDRWRWWRPRRPLHAYAA
jgi:hypothetical protein